MTAAPVHVVLDLRANDRERAYLEDWIRELLDSARGTGALEGSSVLEDGDRRFLTLRFATRADHERWSASPEVASVIEHGDAFVHRKPPVERTGLETWFALAGTEAAVDAPPQWKMALVPWGALLPLIVALSFVIPALTWLLRSWLCAPSA